MSNLPITNSVSMNQNYLPQARELPKADKARDPLLSKAFTNAVVDNSAALKDGNVMINRDALERLFDMFESAVRAIRTLLSNQGILPKSTPDADPLKKALSESSPDLKLNSDKSLKPGNKMDSKLTTAAEANAKTKLLSNAASTLVMGEGTQPQAPATGTLKSKLPSEPASDKPQTAAMTPKALKADTKLLSDIAAKAMPDAHSRAELLSGKTKSTSPVDVTPKEIKADGKSLSEIAAKALSDAAKQVKVTPETKTLLPVLPGKDLKNSPDGVTQTKTLHRDAPGVKVDTAQENKQGTDINVNVQVFNCGFHHPEANVISYRSDTLHVDGQPAPKLNTPNQPKLDGQPKPTPGLKTPDQPKLDGQPKPMPGLNTPDQPKFDGQPEPMPGLKTPDQPKLDGQPKPMPGLKTPDQPKLDDQPKPMPKFNKPNEPRGDTPPPMVRSTPNTPNGDNKPPVGTPGTNTKSEGPLPAFTPEPRPKLDLTAPGPADEQSVGIFNSRNRNRFDNAWASNAGRPIRA
ncbi:hypothetical protein [Pseudomonas sp.]|uniref:hypothetical protein n=1 Tax=Pseudomonas sp. TaxID=306 RepID=UPI003C35ADB5